MELSERCVDVAGRGVIFQPVRFIVRLRLASLVNRGRRKSLSRNGVSIRAAAVILPRRSQK